MTIHISTPIDLQNINNDLTADYILDNNIDLAGVIWVPIGTSSTPFMGSFDGNKKTIKNLTVDDTGVPFGCCGLFAQVGDFSKIIIIKDFIIDTISLTGSVNMGIFGNCNSVQISNVAILNINIIAVDCIYGGGFCCSINGIENYPSKITNCAIREESFSSSYSFLGFGGFVGILGEEGGAVEVVGCSVESLTITLSSGGFFLGGFAGLLNIEKVSGCWVVGSIVCSGITDMIIGIGGFIGALGIYVGNFTGEISECSSNVDISISASGNIGYVGGFLGDDSVLGGGG